MIDSPRLRCTIRAGTRLSARIQVGCHRAERAACGDRTDAPVRGDLEPLEGVARLALDARRRKVRRFAYSALQAIRLLFSAQPSATIGAVITGGASFNLQALKEELDRKMASQA